MLLSWIRTRDHGLEVVAFNHSATMSEKQIVNNNKGINASDSLCISETWLKPFHYFYVFWWYHDVCDNYSIC